MSPVIPLPEEPSRQELALQRVVEALKEAAGEGGPRIHRNNALPFNQDDLDPVGAVVVYPVEESGEQVTHDEVREDEIHFRTELRVKVPVTAEKTWAERLDPLYVWLLTVIAQDPTFGGALEDLERRSRSWDAALMDHIYGGMGIEWGATVLSAEWDPREGP